MAIFNAIENILLCLLFKFLVFDCANMLNIVVMLVEKKERIILGIDPGTAVMGYGVIIEKGGKISLLSMGIVKMKKTDDHFVKLKRILDKTLALIDQYQPDAMAIEAPFYGKNIQAMLTLGRAQGMAMAAALSQNIPITEYAPRRIKQSITGKGTATKEQVAAMLQNLLNFKETPAFLDATDGLAVAVCHSFQRIPTGTAAKSYSGWAAFVKENEKRIK